MKILHCPTPTCANAFVLAQAERLLGLESRSISLYKDVFGHLSDDFLCNPQDSFFIRARARWRLYQLARREYDVIHYNFGETIAPNLLFRKLRFFQRLIHSSCNFLEFADTRAFKRAGKAIFFTFQGSDARQGDYCREHYPIHFVHDIPGFYNDHTDNHKRWRIEQIKGFADKIYALNPDLLNVLPEGSEFLPYSSVNFREWDVVPPQCNHPEGPLIIHAPTNRAVKGTDYVLKAIELLRQSGAKFRFELVQGTYEEVLPRFRQADLLIDQLLAGWYGSLAVELMAMGKPVVCYMRESDFIHLPEQMSRDLPLLNATPDSLFDVLRQLLNEVDKWKEIGARSRSFVEKWHDPEKIAQRLKIDYDHAVAQKRELQ